MPPMAMPMIAWVLSTALLGADVDEGELEVLEEPEGDVAVVPTPEEVAVEPALPLDAVVRPDSFRLALALALVTGVVTGEDVEAWGVVVEEETATDAAVLVAPT